MDIFLLRHGETDWNRDHRCQGIVDLDLNGTGVRQANEVAAYLRHERIHSIYSSNLRRAVQTAEVVSREHGLSIQIEPNLRELDHGELEGLTFEEIRDKYGEFIQKWRSEPADLLLPGGERLADVAERAWSAVNRIIDRHIEEHRIVLVSHNFPIVAILCRITNTPLNQYRSFHLDPCGLTHLAFSQNGGWEIKKMNVTRQP